MPGIFPRKIPRVFTKSTQIFTEDLLILDKN